MDTLVDIPLITAITLGLSEVIKRLGRFNEAQKDRWMPSIAVIVAVVVAVFFLDMELNNEVLAGLIAGLSSVGLYSGTKKSAGV